MSRNVQFRAPSPGATSHPTGFSTSTTWAWTRLLAAVLCPSTLMPQRHQSLTIKPIGKERSSTDAALPSQGHCRGLIVEGPLTSR